MDLELEEFTLGEPAQACGTAGSSGASLLLGNASATHKLPADFSQGRGASQSAEEEQREEQGRSEEVCKFVRGVCPREHNRGAPCPPSRVCHDFQQTGRCKRGDLCLFEHPRATSSAAVGESKPAAAAAPQPRVRIPCIIEPHSQFIACMQYRADMCPRGDRCWLSHDPSAPAPRCELYQRGWCSLGTSCMFPHEGRDPNWKPKGADDGKPKACPDFWQPTVRRGPACLRGDACTFSHDPEYRPDCVMYRDMGGCVWGSKCKAKHGDEPPVKDEPKGWEVGSVCIGFRKGLCHRGEGCSLRHNESLVRPCWEFQFQVDLVRESRAGCKLGHQCPLGHVHRGAQRNPTFAFFTRASHQAAGHFPAPRATHHTESFPAPPQEGEAQSPVFSCIRPGTAPPTRPRFPSPCVTPPPEPAAPVTRRAWKILRCMCLDFRLTGACPEGERCMWSHVEKECQRCVQWVRTGGCRRGRFCKFGHGLQDAGSESPEKLAQAAAEAAAAAAASPSQSPAASPCSSPTLGPARPAAQTAIEIAKKSTERECRENAAKKAVQREEREQPAAQRKREEREQPAAQREQPAAQRVKREVIGSKFDTPPQQASVAPPLEIPLILLPATFASETEAATAAAAKEFGKYRGSSASSAPTQVAAATTEKTRVEPVPTPTTEAATAAAAAAAAKKASRPSVSQPTTTGNANATEIASVQDVDWLQVMGSWRKAARRKSALSG